VNTIEAVYRHAARQPEFEFEGETLVAVGVERQKTPVVRVGHEDRPGRVNGKTVGELIDNIERDYPGFATRIMDEQGDLRRFVNIYLNDEDVRYLGGKDTPLNDGDSVSFLPALAGGI